MTTNGHSLDGWRTDPMYSYSEAAHLARVSTSTVRNWLRGFTPSDVLLPSRPPIFGDQDDQGFMVSFLTLVEIIVAARLRKAERAKYRTVYLAYQNAQQEYGFEYPFAHINLEAIGNHIVHYLHGTAPSPSVQAIDEPQQWSLPGLLHDFEEQHLDYERDLASRWHPLGRSVDIVVDPRFSSGVPTIAGRGVTIGAINKRFYQGKLSIEFIADDFQLDPELVQHALRFKEQLAA